MAAAEESGDKSAVLRVAARRMADGGIDYIMGFDERGEGDVSIESEGVVVVFAPEYGELLANTTLDYVKLDDGEENFIFLDPVNPRHKGGGGTAL